MFNHKPFSAILCNDIIACLVLIFRWKRIEPSSSSWLATLLSPSWKVTRLTSGQSHPAELFWAWSWVTTATWVTNNSVPPSKTSRGSSQTISVANPRKNVLLWNVLYQSIQHWWEFISVSICDEWFKTAKFVKMLCCADARWWCGSKSRHDLNRQSAVTKT